MGVMILVGYWDVLMGRWVIRGWRDGEGWGEWGCVGKEWGYWKGMCWGFCLI